MGSFNDMVQEGIDRIWSEDSKSQEEYLKVIAECRKMPVEALIEISAFFVPNDTYLLRYFPDDVKLPGMDVYNFDGTCKWSNFLVVPIFNVVNEIVAFGGFNPFLYMKSHEPDGMSEDYYQYSSSQLFKKGNYVYAPKGIQERAMEDGYVFVTDGLFDTVSLVHDGFNAFSLMSSTLTNEILVQLKLVDRVILVPDNDAAGITLTKKLKQRLPKLEVFKPKHVKDVDEYLKGEFRGEAIQELKNCLNGINQFSKISGKRVIANTENLR